MNFSTIHHSNSHVLLRCISGSKAYGLSTSTSDTDIRGVFISPQQTLYGLEFEDQFNDDKNDIVYYELRKFMNLLVRNNPNIMELLAVPVDCILWKHPLFDQLKVEDYLSKLAGVTFGRYAFAQIEKARGLNKKIVNPMEKKRKGLLDFCWVGDGQGSVLLRDWLDRNNLKASDCGCISIHHMKNYYHLFVGSSYKGITDKDDVQIVLSSIDKDQTPTLMFYCNFEGFQKYCVEYNEYWKWVEHRNQSRYESTLQHGKNYDAKNMMHTFRLLAMAYEIATEKKLHVRRKERDFLMKIRQGDYEYDELVKLANEKMEQVEAAFLKSDLPDKPDIEMANERLISIRSQWYNPGS